MRDVDSNAGGAVDADAGGRDGCRCAASSPTALQQGGVDPAAGSRLADRAGVSVHEAHLLLNGAERDHEVRLSVLRRWSPWPHDKWQDKQAKTRAARMAHLRLQRIAARQDDLTIKMRSAEQRAAMVEYESAREALHKFSPDCLVYGWVRRRVTKAIEALKELGLPVPSDTPSMELHTAVAETPSPPACVTGASPITMTRQCLLAPSPESKKIASPVSASLPFKGREPGQLSSHHDTTPQRGTSAGDARDSPTALLRLPAVARPAMSPRSAACPLARPKPIRPTTSGGQMSNGSLQQVLQVLQAPPELSVPLLGPLQPAHQVDSATGRSATTRDSSCTAV